MSNLTRNVKIERCHTRRYWSNPDNVYHGQYQRVVTRVFLTFLILSFVLMSMFEYGISNTITGLAMSAVVSILLCAIIPILSMIILSFLDWITGH